MREAIHEFEKLTDLKDMLNKTVEKFGDRPAYVFKTEEVGKFKEITYKEFKNDIDGLGTALINLGLKDKRIAVIGENRYEWAVSYLAVTNGTGIVVPLDKALPNNEIESLIIRSKVEAIVYTNKYDDIMNELKDKKNTDLKYFISMDLEESTDGVIAFNKLIEKGKEQLNDGDQRFLDAEINSDVMGIMLFTSGTTSQSKAVMLSHKNIVSNLMDLVSVVKIDENDRFLSFLPLHHTFECTAGFLFPISKGSSIAFCEGIRHIADNIKEYDITIMISVPVLYENMAKKIINSIEKKGKLKTVNIGRKISNTLLKVGLDIRNTLFKEIHQSLGAKLRLLIAGGAALNPETEKLFNEIGITMYQGYGLTETSPVIAVEDDKFRRIGSIGKALCSLDVKIQDENEEGIGELLVKGPTVMLGYYKNEEATKETIDENGWLHTGDLAKIDKDGFIFITGRKKFVIVLKNGKNVYPEELEILINKIAGVSESFVYGKLEDDGDYKISAKIVYDKDIMKDVYGLEDKQEIRNRLWQEIKIINRTMPKYKYIKDIIITDEALQKTTTQKIKRHVEMKKIEENVIKM
ncbi:MAG: AMP-binding protein [Clostridia bacterium]|nr:AMP-binding protein [Clostridia bacterium]